MRCDQPYDKCGNNLDSHDAHLYPYEVVFCASAITVQYYRKYAYTGATSDCAAVQYPSRVIRSKPLYLYGISSNENMALYPNIVAQRSALRNQVFGNEVFIS
jgi:hypothetical protein